MAPSVPDAARFAERGDFAEVQVKTPGAVHEMTLASKSRPWTWTFTYAEAFGEASQPAYETLCSIA